MLKTPNQFVELVRFQEANILCGGGPAPDVGETAPQDNPDPLLFYTAGTPGEAWLENKKNQDSLNNEYV